MDFATLPQPVETDVESRVDPLVVVHGGAGTIDRASMTDAKRDEVVAALHAAAKLAWDHAARGGRALDAAQLAVMSMEAAPVFNAGVGAVFRSDGTHRHDASIVDGATRAYGAVTQITTTLFPIAAARWAFEHRRDRAGLFLAGADADALANDCGVPQVDNAAFATPHRREQWERARAAGSVHLDHDGKLGTVGAVVRDRSGRLAAATSTGGMTNAEPARIGDSAIVGAGTWADARCAISCTGEGETLLAHAVAARVAARVEAGDALEVAAGAVLDALPAGTGGLIAVSADGVLIDPRNTGGMYRARVDGQGRCVVAIYDDEIPLGAA
ncbi:MAG: isoaspartyl peptidase/L-asparaginase [Deltaproteobacteria bacterium]|jgi:beta-aspartyl-peptidase (threonine type)